MATAVRYCQIVLIQRKFKESCFAYEIDMLFHGELFIQVETKVSDGTGENNSSLADGQRCGCFFEF